MGKYNRAVITDQGEALRARAIAGEATMQFAHAKTSSYIYPDGTDLTKLTELQEVKQTVIPSNVQISNETLISVRTLFGNEKISEEYLIQNVGIYASDGEKEILFAVCQAIIPDQMPVYDGVAPSSFIYNVQLTVSQATDISLVISGAGTATTEDILDLEKSVEEVDKKKIDASGGDISDTVITSAEEPTAEYPVPAAGDSTKVFLGKTRKFFSDIKNWMTGVCMLGQIVNNCVTDNAKLPLSAAQGKSLMDLYNVLNTKSQNIVIIRQYSAKITLRSNTYDEFSIPFTIPSGYKFVGIVRAWVTNEEIVTVNAYTKTVSSTDVTMSLFNKSSNAITASSYINLLFLKD